MMLDEFKLIEGGLIVLDGRVPHKRIKEVT
mgnify:CR=1 FL=1